MKTENEQQQEPKTREVLALEQVFKQNDCLSILEFNNLKKDLIILIYDLQIASANDLFTKINK